MEEIVKHINDTNASYRTVGAGDAKNTDLFLDNEHYELFRGSGEQITVKFNKENLTKAILFIASILPRKYDNSSIHKKIPFTEAFVYDQLAFLDGFFTVDGVKVESRTQIWTARKDVLKKNGEVDNRFYFNGLLEDVSYTSFGGIAKSAKFTIRNYLAGGYSDLHIKKSENGIFDVWITNALEPYNDGKENGREIFDTDSKSQSLQQIYYGAPGTGKSYEITQKTKGSKDVVRTTFHPDSDYSTFVGAYKPTMGKGKVYGAQGPLRDNGKDIEEPKIVYEFVEQAFLQAYISAWEKYAKDHEEKQFLVIEEINRGNCAQIFGDIFQLLDRRKDGFSDYPINPDKDIRLHLKQKLEGLSLTDIPTIDNIDGNDLGVMICNGEKMLLPPNLYIWATMNTSDQSLFPIDSAFKRRWDWKYMPIDTKKECWYIKVGDDRYSWTAFLEKVNNELLTDETAEDKHLGFYFCKAENSEIAIEKFVGKVLFYLWNDVFKVYGIPSAIGSSKDWGYTKFYNSDGSVNEQKVADLMKQLKIVAEGSIDGNINGQIEEQS